MEVPDGEYIFTQDFLFSSPSTAAAVVLGRSATGWVEGADTASDLSHELISSYDYLPEDMQKLTSGSKRRAGFSVKP